jgi:hypothetical protein
VGVFVFYRTPNPDNGTVAKVKEIFEQEDMDYSGLMEWTTDHCQTVDSVYQEYVLERELADPVLGLLGK